MYNGQASPKADTPADTQDDTPNDASAAQSGLAEDAEFDDGSYKPEAQLEASIVPGAASGIATVITSDALTSQAVSSIGTPGKAVPDLSLQKGGVAAATGDGSSVDDPSSAAEDGGMIMGDFLFCFVLAELIVCS